MFIFAPPTIYKNILFFSYMIDASCFFLYLVYFLLSCLDDGDAISLLAFDWMFDKKI